MGALSMGSDNIPLLLAQLEQGEASDEDVLTLRHLVLARIYSGRMDGNTARIITQYIKDLLEEQGLHNGTNDNQLGE